MGKKKIYARQVSDKYLLYLVLVIVIIIVIIIAVIFTISKTVSLFMIIVFFIALARHPRLWYMFWRLIRTIWRKGVVRQYSKYKRWSKGAKGEEIVAKWLEDLGASYKVFNDLKFPDFDGNIDHLVIGKNGIFIVETKHFSGNVYCEKDTWNQEIKGKIKYIRSPSSQIKRNAVNLKGFIESKTSLKGLWVQGIVVISNEDCDIEVKESTVPILRPHQIKDYIEKQEIKFAQKDVPQIEKLIEKFSSLTQLKSA